MSEDDEWTQQQKLTADDAAAGDRFGSSVSISDNYAIIGAPDEDDDDNRDSGSAYIFKLGGGEWDQLQKLTADDAAAGDTFGKCVSIKGDYTIIGGS